MKDGTLYAGKLKKAFNKQRQSTPAGSIPEPDDPIRRLAISVLGEDCGDESASAALDRLLKSMVDWNEIRVSTPDQVAHALGDKIPDVVERARRLSRALHGVYLHEHCISLERLRNLGRREARDYLEALEGVNDYSAAAVMLWSLGGHAIPVHDDLLRALRNAGLVHESASRVEVQAFLERNIPAAQAKEFCLVMKNFTAPKRAASSTSKAARKKEKSAK